LWGTPVRPQKTKGTANYVVAASDAPASVKAIADYVCDGTADDVQFQAALDALPAEGGKVYGTAGDYLFTGNLEIPSNTTLEFATGNTIKVAASGTHTLDTDTKSKNNSTVAYVIGNENVEGSDTNIHIIGAVIDMEAGASTSHFAEDKSYTGIWLESCSNSSIKNCTVIDCVYDLSAATGRAIGILMSDCDDSTISECEATGCGYEGIGVRNECNNILVENCRASGNVVHCMQAANWWSANGADLDTNPQYITFSNCKGMDDDIIIHSTQGLARDIIGGKITGCEALQIIIQGEQSGFNITNCTVVDVLILKSQDDATISGGTITGCTIGTNRATGSALNLQGDGSSGHAGGIQNVTISGNLIWAEQSYPAIKLYGTTAGADVFKNINITGNTIDSTDTDASGTIYAVYIENTETADWEFINITDNTFMAQAARTVPITFSITSTGDIRWSKVDGNIAGQDCTNFVYFRETGTVSGEIQDIQILNNVADLTTAASSPYQGFIGANTCTARDIVVKNNYVVNCEYVIDGGASFTNLIVTGNKIDAISAGFMNGSPTNLFVKDNDIAGTYHGIAIAKTADYIVPIEYSGYTFTNNGDAGAMTYTLPAAIPGLVFTFGDVENGGGIDLTVTANGAEIFRGFDTTIIADDDAVQFITILCTETGVWDIMSSTGTWD